MKYPSWYKNGWKAKIVHYTLTYIDKSNSDHETFIYFLFVFSICCNIIQLYGRATEILTFYSSLIKSPYSSAVEIAKLYLNWLNDEQKVSISVVKSLILLFLSKKSITNILTKKTWKTCFNGLKIRENLYLVSSFYENILWAPKMLWMHGVF